MVIGRQTIGSTRYHIEHHVVPFRGRRITVSIREGLSSTWHSTTSNINYCKSVAGLRVAADDETVGADLLLSLPAETSKLCQSSLL
jgi:hypothetical protein